MRSAYPSGYLTNTALDSATKHSIYRAHKMNCPHVGLGHTAFSCMIPRPLGFTWHHYADKGLGAYNDVDTFTLGSVKTLSIYRFWPDRRLYRRACHWGQSAPTCVDQWHGHPAWNRGNVCLRLSTDWRRFGRHRIRCTLGDGASFLGLTLRVIRQQ